MGLATLTLRVVNRNCAAHREGLHSSGPVCLVIICLPRIDIENYKLLILLLDMNFATQNFMFLEIWFLHFDPFFYVAPPESTLLSNKIIIILLPHFHF